MMRKVKVEAEVKQMISEFNLNLSLNLGFPECWRTFNILANATRAIPALPTPR